MMDGLTDSQSAGVQVFADLARSTGHTCHEFGDVWDFWRWRTGAFGFVSDLRGYPVRRNMRMASNIYE